MLIGLFKNKNPLEYVVLLLYSFLFYGVLFFKTDVKILADYSFFTHWLRIDPIIIQKNYLILLSIVLSYIQIVLFFGMVRKFGLSNDHSLISAFIYITLTGIYPGMIILSPASISFFVLIFAIYNLFLTYDIEFPLQKFFFISLYLGICTIFYFPMCVFLIFLIISLPAIKTPSFRELMIIIVGYLIPFYFLSMYYFMTDQIPFFKQVILENIPGDYFTVVGDYQSYIAPIAFTAVIFLMALMGYLFQSSSRTIRLIIYNRIIITCIIISLGIMIVLPGKRWLMGPYILAPVSIFIGNMLSDNSRKIFNQVVFSILLLIIVYTEYVFYKM